MQETFRLEDLLNVLIELENVGAAHYKRLHLLSSHLKSKALFEKLSNEELKHELYYKSLKQRLLKFEINNLSDEYKSYAKALLSSTITFLKIINKGLDESNVLSESDEFKAGIENALKLEKDTILLLIELKQILEVTTHAEIDGIIEQERNHVKLVIEMGNGIGNH